MSWHWRPKKKKKAGNLKRHFKMRCIQRIGAPLDEEELKRRMRANMLSWLWRESNTKTHFSVPRDMLPKGFNREIEVVYDSDRHEFVTILFKDGIEFKEILDEVRDE